MFNHIRELAQASFNQGIKAGTHPKPLLLIGEPGGGKTSLGKLIAKDIAKAHPDKDVGFIYFNCSTARAEDFNAPNLLNIDSKGGFDMVANVGLPFVGNDNVPEYGVILLDEATQTGRGDSAKAMTQFLPPNNKLGNFDVKPGWISIGTGNAREHNSGSSDLLRHMANRFFIIENVKPSLDEWLTNATVTGHNHEIISFTRSSNGQHIWFDPSKQLNPTHRAWSDVSDMMSEHMSDAAFQLMIRGKLGDGPAAQFQAYRSLAKELPHPLEILESPQMAATFEVPDFKTKPSLVWYLVSALSSAATYSNAPNYITAIKRAVPTDREDMLVSAVLMAQENKQAALINDSFADSPEFRDAMLPGGAFESIVDAMNNITAGL